MQMLFSWASETRSEWRQGFNWTDESKIEVMIYEDLVSLPFEKIEEHYQSEDESNGE